MKKTENKDWYWLAINGASCSACPIPSPTIAASPTPEYFLGVKTQKEQLERQKFFLWEPIEIIEVWQEKIPALVKAGKIKFVGCDNPQPPQPTTNWTLKGEKV